MAYNLRYSPPRNHSAFVAIHADHYNRRVAYAEQLVRELRSSIPFDCQFGEPEVCFLAGPCNKFKMSVVVRINYAYKDGAVVEMLAKHGFLTPLEPVLI